MIDRSALYRLFGYDEPPPQQLRGSAADLRLRPDLSPEERARGLRVGGLGYRSAGARQHVSWQPPEGG